MHRASAKIIADSINEQGNRLTTFQLRYWRPIHSELMTHRMFSRNASSSRARPSKAIIEQVIKEPWEPIEWGKNQSGMQAKELLSDEEVSHAKFAWKNAASTAGEFAKILSESMGVHKQIVNRLLEPFTYIDVLVSATEYANWFALRDHPDAQPEIQYLARLMKEAMANSKPKLLYQNDWHLPYITEEEKNKWDNTALALDISAARCARVSYKAFDGNPSSIEDDLKLVEKLKGSFPKHMTPFEHQARPANDSEGWEMQANFTGWVQYRKLINGEYIEG